MWAVHSCKSWFIAVFITGIIPFSCLGGFYANLGLAYIFLRYEGVVLRTNGLGREALLVARLTHEPEAPGSKPGPVKYFLVLFR